MNEPLRTLVVEDEDRIQFFLRETLERVGHTVTTVSSGEEALELLQDTEFDVILLDLILGGRIEGQRVLEAVRWRWPATVVIMLTAHGSLESAVDAIREGVDGYLLKPVKPDDVREAVKEALYRREQLVTEQTKEAEEVILRKGPIAIDLRKHTATFNERALDLSPRELALLRHLLERAPEVIGPKELVAVVRDYKPEHMYEAREIIKWYIHRLRKKVEPDPSKPRYILNVRGVGYRFAE
jgi:DNA-binding response OmpR family regulator